MKKSILAFALLPLFLSVKAQSLIGGGNIVKVNLSSLALGTYNVTYERKILPHITASIGISKMPKRGLPFQNEVKNLANTDIIDYDNAKVGNFTVTPELRLYLIGAGHGLYIAPYGRYTSMDLDVPIHYQTQIVSPTTGKTSIETVDALFTGNIKATSGGLMIGTQFQLLKKVVLDLWIVGAHFGNGKGDFTTHYKQYAPTNQAIVDYEAKSIRDGLGTLKPKPFVVDNVKVDSKTSDPTASMSISGPWTGIRALGLNVGIRF